MIQWLGLGTSTTQSVSWIPAQGTKLLRTVCYDQKKKKDTTNTKKRWGGFSIFLHFTHSEGFSIELVGGGARRTDYAEVMAAFLQLSTAPPCSYLGGPSISVAMEICSGLRKSMDLSFHPTISIRTCMLI